MPCSPGSVVVAFESKLSLHGEADPCALPRVAGTRGTGSAPAAGGPDPDTKRAATWATKAATVSSTAAAAGARSASATQPATGPLVPESAAARVGSRPSESDAPEDPASESFGAAAGGETPPTPPPQLRPAGGAAKASVAAPPASGAELAAGRSFAASATPAEASPSVS